MIKLNVNHQRPSLSKFIISCFSLIQAGYIGEKYWKTRQYFEINSHVILLKENLIECFSTLQQINLLTFSSRSRKKVHKQIV